MRRNIVIVALVVVTLIGALPSVIFANGASDDMKQANQFVEQAIVSAEQGDLQGAKKQFESFHTTWFNIEEGVKKQSKAAYKGIEDAMGQVQFAFAQNPANKETVLQGLNQLKQINIDFINGRTAQDNPSDSKNGNNNVAHLVDLLDGAIHKIQENDVAGAKQNIEQFRQAWLDIEGIVLTQSSKVYNDAERDMVTSYAFLSSNPPDSDSAMKTIRNMRDYLAPLSAKTSYGMFDATSILLREGLEALLIIVALLGFLTKTGHQDKKPWIWYGVGAGVLVSIAIGIAVQILFSAGTFGNNNFLITGWTGLFAAVMLLYMSYWLHSKSSISQWQRYIREKSTTALAKGSLWSVAILSFLAVFREGTETVLFFIGMASSIQLSSLLAGIGIGIAVLALLSYFILKVGLKIPMRPFFLVSSVLVFYLCFKFVGMGIHGLQLANVLPASHTDAVPTVSFFAIYSTWESIVPQVLLLIAAVAVALWNRRKDRMEHNQIKM